LASILLALADKEYGSSTLKSLGAQTQYGYTASATNTPVGPRFVRITDIRRALWTGRLCLTANVLNRRSICEGRRHSCSPNRIDGKSFLVGNVPEESVFASYLIRIRGEAKLQPRMYWALQSAQFWDHVSGGRGTAQRMSTRKSWSSSLYLLHHPRSSNSWPPG